MIDVRSLNFRYPKGDTPTLRNLNFNIQAGEIFGFLGPSGSGKSTTQKLLIGLLRNFDGEIQILGKNATEWRHDFYQKIGVGFELPNHFSKLTALENLELFASFYAGTTRQPMELLRMLGLGDATYKAVGEFSKGMKMRLNFARAIIHDPVLLFLDEPTAGLDPVNARAMKDIILDLKGQGKTIFLTTHNMHDADELCDRVAFIVDGEITQIDSPRTLKLKYGSAQVRVDESSEQGTKSHYFGLDGLAENQAFLSVLRTDRIEAIHSQEATLEDVFIKTTGRELRT